MGTVFRINLDGTGYGVLTNFNGDEGVSITLYGTNLYGTTSVRGKLGGGLYGPTSVLGNVGGGAIFKMNLDGTGLTVIRNFSAAEGAPTAVVAVGNTLYGSTVGDGESNNAGTVFKINPDGTGYSLLHSLAAPADGIWPNSGVILGGGALYGTTHLGGANNSGGGTLFTCDPNSTDYKVVYNIGSNGEGGWASGRLLLCGSTLVETAAGGNFFPSFGSVFMVNIDGSGFTLLKTFFQTDGAYPTGGLTLSGTTLYGTTAQGGAVTGFGVIFSLSLPPPSRPSVQTPPITQRRRQEAPSL
jgi:uncharacterized repeat protein (TIGR03803 family)